MHGVKFVIKLDVGLFLDYNKQYADVAELVDALASGASASNGVKVQVLSSAPKLRFIAITQAQCVCFLYFSLCRG